MVRCGLADTVVEPVDCQSCNHMSQFAVFLRPLSVYHGSCAVEFLRGGFSFLPECRQELFRSFNIHNVLYFVKYISRAARNSPEGHRQPAGRGLKTHCFKTFQVTGYTCMDRQHKQQIREKGYLHIRCSVNIIELSIFVTM